MRTALAALIAISLTAACVDPGLEEEELGSGEEAITPGAPAVDWMVRRAAKPADCTATLIGRRYVLTALHCTWSSIFRVPWFIHFYVDASGFSSLKAIYSHVYIPPGTDMVSDRYDDRGRIADMAIVELDTDAPSSSVPATLAWEYPGYDVQGFRVGAGAHDHMDNPDGALRYRAGRTGDDEATSGEFHLQDFRVDGNDSGGPFYVDYRVLGVLLGHAGGRDVYTNVPDQLPWILDTIGWTWTHAASTAGIYRAGVSLESFLAETEKVCQYACDRTGACGAYNYAPAYDICELVQNPNDVVASSFFRSALK